MHWVAGLLALAAATASAGTPATGGVRLLEAMESAGRVVVGRVDGVERLDTHGYAATLTIETVVGASSGRVDTTLPLRIAWEELSSARPPRFAPGERVLLCLEPLGSDSIWTQRLPDPTRRAGTAGIAMNGGAFLRQPRLGTLDRLHHYLALSPENRETTIGIHQLSALAASARPVLATSAARRLARIETWGGALTPQAAADLSRALARPDLPDDFEKLWRPTLSQAGGPLLVQAVRQALRHGPASPRLFEALATLDALSEAETGFLRAHASPSYRSVLARTSVSPTLLRRLVGSDENPQVRSDALARLLNLEGARALPEALAALADSDPRVRARAAAGAGDLGRAAVKGLESVAYGTFEPCAGSLEAPSSAISGLSRSGVDGRRALAKIAADHPEEAQRRLARIALGELETHGH
jgi:hypothetical protein